MFLDRKPWPPPSLRPDGSGTTRVLMITGIALVLALMLTAALALRAWQDPGRTNGYALVAEALLHGRADVDDCFDSDCAVHEGRRYIVFPPGPALTAVPLVAAFGESAPGFVLLGALLAAVALLLWWRILAQLQVDAEARLWLLGAVAFAGPLYAILLKAGWIWQYAQVVAFLGVTLAIHETLARRFVLAGLALTLAILSRQMSVLYIPLLALLALPPGSPLLPGLWARRATLLGVLVPIGIGVLLYLGYNAWRFGNPFDTGYAYIGFPETFTGPRVAAHGLWSVAYVPFNFLYSFVQGFHAEFAAPELTRITGLDPAGTSILAASPWLLYLFFTPIRRVTLLCLAIIGGLAALMLFYHSNGYAQFNVQRYALDWFPAAMMALAYALPQARLDTFRLLVVWGMALNLASLVVLAVARGA